MLKLSGSTGSLRFIGRLFRFSIVTWVSTATSFIAVPISTRLYLPSELGKINLFSVYSTLIILIVYMGLDQAFVRFYYEPPGNKSQRYLITFCLSISTIVIIPTGILILIFGRYFSLSISGEVNSHIPYLLILSVLTSVIIRYLNLTYRMQQNVKSFTVLGILIIIVTKFSYLISGFINPFYQTAISAIVITQAVLAFSFLYIQRKLFLFSGFKYNKQFAIVLLKFGLPLLPIAILSWANNSIASLILQRLLSYESIGIYTSAVAIASMVSIVQSGFNTYWVAYVFENYKTQTTQFFQVHKTIVSSMIIMGLGIILLQDVIFLLLGEKYRAAKVFFPFLLLTPVCYTIAETTGLGIEISKKTYLNSITFILALALNVSLCLILLPVVGISGAAVAAAVSSITTLFCRTYFGEKNYKVVTDYSYMIFGIIIILISSFITMYTQDLPIFKYSCLSVITITTLVFYRKTIIELIYVLTK